MIIDLERFAAAERPCWTELEAILDRLENDPGASLDLPQARRFHYLYQRTSADLAKIATFASEPRTRRYLESLVARAYGEIHETRERAHRLAFLEWLTRTFPQTFRRHLRAFWLSLAITLVGAGFGGVAVTVDPDAKAALLPFSHLLGDPRERVAREEQTANDRLAGAKASFSTTLMTHNTRVALLTLSLGMTFGLGTILVLFYNGVILGAVGFDYALAGQSTFMLGWLLPHGVIEIPAILMAGQAGLLLGGALLGRHPGGQGAQSSNQAIAAPMGARLRAVRSDLVTLMAGVGLLLVWAGFVEAFLSQYHEPVFPYPAKIGFGLAELALLILFLARAGLGPAQPAPRPPA